MCTHRQQSLLGVIYQGLSTRSLTCLELPKQAKLTGQQTQILLLLPPLLGSQLCDHGLLHELLQTDLRFPHSCGGAPLHSYLPSPSLRVQLHSIPVLDKPLPSALLAVSSVQLL